MARHLKTDVESLHDLHMLHITRHDGMNTVSLDTAHKSGREIAQDLIQQFDGPDAPKPDAYNFRGLDLSGADLRGLDLRVLGEAALRQIDFSGANLSGQNFSGLNLKKAQFEGAVLTEANFSGANLEQANMQHCLLGSASMQNVTAFGARMDDIAAPLANWSGRFGGASLSGDMSFGTFGSGTSFENAKMRGVDMTGAKALDDNVSFESADLTGAKMNGDFGGVTFTNAQMTQIHAEGGQFENSKTRGADITGMQTDGAGLTAAKGAAMVQRGSLDYLQLTMETLALDAPKPKAKPQKNEEKKDVGLRAAAYQAPRAQVRMGMGM